MLRSGKTKSVIFGPSIYLTSFTSQYFLFITLSLGSCALQVSAKKVSTSHVIGARPDHRVWPLGSNDQLCSVGVCGCSRFRLNSEAAIDKRLLDTKFLEMKNQNRQ